MDSQFHNGKRTQRGVSLIEVLVVLVILVVGILTIIRLFPSGFFSIQSTGNAGQADTLGTGALGLASQNAQNFPEAILPDNLLSDDLISAAMNAAAYSNYDPEDPNNLNNARIVSNETITVPSVSSGQSVYVVNYGPVLMPNDPAVTAAAFPSYFTVNSTYWAPLSGSSGFVGGTTVPTTPPQDTLIPGQERLLVDLTNKKIAVPYAAYTPIPGGATLTLGNGTTTPSAASYAQKIVVVITCDTGTYTKYLNVPAATSRDSANPYAPMYVDAPNHMAYLPDANVAGGSGYQGDWFKPETEYGDATPGVSPPSTANWISVALYRPYNGITTLTAFDTDPYEFKLIAGNFGTANPGSIGFNPKAAGGSGAQARKAKISYIVSSWKILREDHDIPALAGAGSTFVVRTTVPNLKLAGSANPDNSINPGIAGSNYSLVILDLDSGKIIAPGGTADPTNPDKPTNNEDVNGTMNDPALINISYSTGRLTFGSNAFGDNNNNVPTAGAGTAPAHRIRIFYTADLDWTVAVQKPAAYFNKVPALGTPPETTPLAADEFVYDPSVPCVYVARCNAGKTFEVDGTATPSGGGTARTFSQTIAAGLVLVSLGAPDVQIPLPATVTGGSTINFSAVRGLSARSVVAWKERNRYKVHSVDTLLNRTP